MTISFCFDGSGAVRGVTNGMIDAVFPKIYSLDNTADKSDYIYEIKKSIGITMVSLYRKMENGESFSFALDIVIKTWVEGIVDMEYKLRGKPPNLDLNYIHRVLGGLVWDYSDYSGYSYRQREIKQFNEKIKNENAKDKS